MTAEAIPWWRRLRRRFYWLLALKLWWLAQVVPLTWGRALGRALARAAAAARPGDRRRAARQLAWAFPTATPAELDTLLIAGTRALGRNLFDALATGRLLRRPGLVVAEADRSGRGPIAVLEELLAAGRGAFVLTGHLGCWELLGAWLARELARRRLGPLAVVTGTIHNPPVDRLVQGWRRRAGMIVLPRSEGARPLLRHLRAGGVVAVLQDQRTAAENLEVPFFGRPAPTPAGLARIAVRHGVPVLPLAIAWQADGARHVVRQQPPLWPPAATGADADAAVRDLLTASNACLEAFVRRNPAEWVWFHARWADGDPTRGDDR